MLDSKIPAGKLEDKWVDYKGHCKLVNPANKRKLEIIVIGTGLAGASAAASLGELGYKVKAFCFQDSPRRAPQRITRMTATPYSVYFTIP
jgi:succinate dehydrogenase / fumarate reductase, flavoprotein subunit